MSQGCHKVIKRVALLPDSVHCCGGVVLSWSVGLNFGLSGPGLSPGWGHCVVFFMAKMLYSHSTSLYPGEQMGTSKFNAGGNPVMD